MSLAFVGGDRIEPDEERLALLKRAMHFSHTYDVLRGLLFNNLILITSLFIY